EERADGLAEYDLSQHTIAEVTDDARSLSLFASKRLIVASRAEAAMPKGSRSAAVENEEGDEGGGETAASSDVTPLIEYLKSPSPGVVIVFEASRFALEG